MTFNLSGNDASILAYIATVPFNKLSPKRIEILLSKLDTAKSKNIAKSLLGNLTIKGQDRQIANVIRAVTHTNRRIPQCLKPKPKPSCRHRRTFTKDADRPGTPDTIHCQDCSKWWYASKPQWEEDDERYKRSRAVWGSLGHW